jgi:hypothetical protein
MGTSRKAVVVLLVRLSEQFPGFAPTAATVSAWERALEPYTDDQIERGGDSVSRTHRFGAPSTAHIAEAIEGRIESVRVSITDHWNRAILRNDGTLAYALERRRVFPDGRVLRLDEHEDGEQEMLGPVGSGFLLPDDFSDE